MIRIPQTHCVIAFPGSRGTQDIIVKAKDKGVPVIQYYDYNDKENRISMYNFIKDYDELRFFYDNIMPPLKDFEVYFMSLSARNKYLTSEEQKSLNLGRTEMFARKICRKKEWNRFIRNLKCFETVEGSYTTKNNSNIPEKCITLYWNLNPSNSLKAYREYQKIVTDYLFEVIDKKNKDNDNTENISYRMNKLDILLMNCYQKNKGTKWWIDLDFDINKKDKNIILDPFLNDLNKLEVFYYVIETHSGYHIILRKDTVNFNLKAYTQSYTKRYYCYLTDQDYTENGFALINMTKTLHEEFGYEIIINHNLMIPIPGTSQGGHLVKVLNKKNNINGWKIKEKNKHK